MTSAFVFPSIHAFAPFYTLQPNPQTAAAQVDLWARLVLSYCAAHKHFTVEVDGAWERASDLFCHRGLDRALSPDMIRLILARLVEQGRAVFDPPLPRNVKPMKVGMVEADRRMHALSFAAATQAPGYHIEPGSKVLVYWHTPDEWGDLLYDWIKETGQNKSVLTVYEIEHGTFVQREQLPHAILMLALRSLAARGCAQIFGGSEATDAEADGNLGIKFA